MSAKTRNFAYLALGLCIGLGLGVTRGVLADKPAASAAPVPWEDAHTLAAVIERVKHDYVEKLDDHALLQAAIRGMVASLDPYSAYLDRDEYDEIKISSSGEYSGVGIEVAMEDDQVIVVSPIEGSPAAQAGIRSGDVIVMIDGIPVNTTTLADTIERMRGKEGTTVRIGIERDRNAEPLQFTVKRQRVELHSVRAELSEPGFGYVRIAQFSDSTGQELIVALGTLRHRNGGPLKGVVLDLRDNPGGVLEAAVAVADAFIDKGVIVTSRGRTSDSKFEMDATPGDELAGAPLVVLVNGGSASAAEIVAGALKDNHRATLMGRTTFGKGSVQTIMPLTDQTALKLTTSLYYTPSGVSINHKGIAPDIEIKRADAAPEAPDPEIQLAMKELKQESVGHGTGKSLTAAVH
ncbi:MAG: S41 family peptidase [Steroidobacterales bacterium]